MVLDRFFNSNNEPPSKFRQLDKDVQKEQQQEEDYFFGRAARQDPFAAFFNGRDPFEDMMRQHPFFGGGVGRRGRSGYQVQETPNQYTLSIDVPSGVNASDLKLQLMDDAMLCVTGTQKSQNNNKTTSKKSSMESRFQQCFNFGPVDPSRITADLSNGVLVVNAPKVEPVQKAPVDIPISQGSGRPKL